MAKSFKGHVRGQSNGHVHRRSLVPFQCRASRIPAQAQPSREDVRHTPFGDLQVKITAQERVAVGSSIGGTVWMAELF